MSQNVRSVVDLKAGLVRPAVVSGPATLSRLSPPAADARTVQARGALFSSTGSEVTN
jgi:hypothetical protein